jgi:hypothetical protein
MSSADAYFQFPLVLLLYAKDSRRLIQDACSWALLLYGESMEENVRETLAAEYWDTHPDQDTDPDDADDDLCAIAAAAQRLNVNVGNVSRTANEARKMHDRYGLGGLQVRLRMDIAWSAHDETWPLLKLKTLCGVYAGIGNQHAKKMNHRLLRAYCNGHSSPKGLKEFQLVPTSTLRYWLEQLWFKNLYQFCLHGQERWYSNSCKDDLALASVVKAQKQAKKTKTVVSTDDV